MSSKVKKNSVWCILCVVTKSPLKSKIINQRSSTKLFHEPQERSSKVGLLTKGSVFVTVLLVNVYWWELTGLLTELFLLTYQYDVGTLGNESVFAKPLKK